MRVCTLYLKFWELWICRVLVLYSAAVHDYGFVINFFP